MLEFREIRIEDRDRAKKLLSLSGYRGCEYTFGNNFIWSEPFNIKVAFYKDFYIVSSEGEFFYPSGMGDFKEIEIGRGTQKLQPLTGASSLLRQLSQKRHGVS